MPFYEYECPKCGYHDEVLQKISDKPLSKCPSCGKAGVKKLISAPVFRLKGSGWYETDFKSDKENKRNLAGADKDDAKSDGAPDAKSDAATAAKPEAPANSKADAKADAKPVAKPAAARPAPVKSATRLKPKSRASASRRRSRG
jgi:putative FmdB family regulatory protein